MLLARTMQRGGVYSAVAVIQLLSLDFCAANSFSSNVSCPTWTTLDTNSKNISSSEDQQCQCMETDANVMCDPATLDVYLRKCYCMYATNHRFVYGRCLFSCFKSEHSFLKPTAFYRVGRENTSLQHEFCLPFKRHGMFCQDCLDGYYPPLLSNDVKCVECSSSWIMVLVGTLLGPTLFFMFVFITRFKATLGSLNAFILFAQVISSPPVLRVVHLAFHVKPVSVALRYAAYTLLTFYGFWNLDFFIFFLPDICLPFINTMRINIVFNMLPAFYTLFLSLLLIIFNEFYARGYWFMLTCWRPFRSCFSHVRRDWKLGHSLLSVFTTFLLLSHVKILATLFDTSSFIIIRGGQGEQFKFADLRLYFSPKLHHWFDNSVLPITLIVFSLFIILITLPGVLLLCFPVKCFRHCFFSCCSSRTRLSAALFMDSFQGYFKDGTEPGTRDCRYFAGLYQLIRILIYSLYDANLTSLPIIIVVSYALMIAIIKPYKTKHSAFNVIDPVILLILAATYELCSISYSSYPYQYHVLWGLSVVPVMVPLVLTIKWVKSLGVCVRIREHLKYRCLQARVEDEEEWPELRKEGHYGSL